MHRLTVAVIRWRVIIPPTTGVVQMRFFESLEEFIHDIGVDLQIPCRPLQMVEVVLHRRRSSGIDCYPSGIHNVSPNTDDRNIVGDCSGMSQIRVCDLGTPYQ